MGARPLLFVFVLIPIIFLSGCINLNFLQRPVMSGERVSFVTSDGVNIVGSYYDGGDNSVILLPILGGKRSDYNNFAEFLQKKNYTVLSIDMRGNGDSGSGGLTAIDYTKSVNDVAAAKAFILGRGKSPQGVSIIGASIGANIALKYATGDSSIRSIVLLSPGLDYQGITVMDKIVYYSGPLLLVAAQDDSFSASTVRALSTADPHAQFKIYDSGGHGTALLSTTDVRNLILGFLQKVYS